MFLLGKIPFYFVPKTKFMKTAAFFCLVLLLIYTNHIESVLSSLAGLVVHDAPAPTDVAAAIVFFLSHFVSFDFPEGGSEEMLWAHTEAARRRSSRWVVVGKLFTRWQRARINSSLTGRGHHRFLP